VFLYLNGPPSVSQTHHKPLFCKVTSPYYL